MSYYIEYGGAKSSDLGFILETVDYGEGKARTVFEYIPYRDGALNFSKASGKVYFDRRTVAYTFLYKSATVAATNTAVNKFIAWLSECSGEEIYDNFQAAYLQETQFESAKREVIDMFGTAARVTVFFSAAPKFRLPTRDEVI